MRRSDPLLAVVASATLAFAAGCDAGAADRASPGAPERLTLGSEPTLHIGVLEGDADYQFHDVRDARRLSDGRIAVANQGTREVRLYGGDGMFVRASGEEGDGPGQWRAISSLHPAGGDTLLVVDHRLGRHGLVDLGTGQYLGSADSALAARLVPSVRHHRGLLLRAPPEVDGLQVFASVVGALNVGSSEAPTFVQLDAAGRVWVLGAPSEAPSVLSLFDLDGQLRAILPLPDAFRPTQVGPDEIVGVWRDAWDVEHVRAYAVEGGATWPGPSIEDALALGREAPSPGEAELPALSEGFRAIAIAQEIHYGSQASYTTDFGRLNEVRAIELPEGARADILDAGPGGWHGRLVDTATGAGCMLLYGAYGPIAGLDPGRISCWDPSSD